MMKALDGLNFTLAYLDDIIIFSETTEQHLKHIQIVLTRLKQANLKLKKSRYTFFQICNFTTLAIFFLLIYLNGLMTVSRVLSI